MLVVTQDRYVLGRTLLEIPAGKLDPGEDPATGAASGGITHAAERQWD